MNKLIAIAAFASATAAFGQIVLNDGSLGESYAFPLPQALGKYQPVLALQYNSNAGATTYGVGWSITANYINATTHATPNTDGSPRTRHTLVLNGASQLLVPAGDGTYRTDVGRSYFSATRSSNTWRAVDSVGNTYKVASRVMWKMKMAHSSGWETTNPSPGKATTGGTRRGQGYQEAEAGA